MRLVYILFLIILAFSQSATALHYFDFPEQGDLSDEMKAAFHRDGFIVFNDYLSDETCDELRAEGQAIVRDTEIDDDELPIFGTSASGNKITREKYFLNSADKIKLFFEDRAVVDGKLVVEKEDAVNKIAHALGELNPKFRKVTFDPRVAKIAKQLGVTQPALAQSMMILKPKNIGGQVAPHQDASFIFSEPNTCLGFWMPLEDTTTSNACLQAVPGSHTVPLFLRFVRTASGSTEFVKLSNPHWSNEDVNMMDWFSYVPEVYKQFVPLEMKRGSLIVFGGNLIHCSAPNTSDTSRNAYTFHIVDANAKWPRENWLQRGKFEVLESK